MARVDTGDPEILAFRIEGRKTSSLVPNFVSAAVTIDRREGIATTNTTVLGTPGETTYRLDRVDAVTIEPSGKVGYPIAIAGPDGLSIAVDCPHDWEEARAVAEEVARFLDLKVVDRSDGVEIVRATEELDESVRDRHRRKGTEPRTVKRPFDARTAYEQRGDTHRFAVPRMGLDLKLTLLFCACGILPYIGYTRFLSHARPDILGGLILSATGMGLMGLLAHVALRRYEIEASPGELRIVQRGLVRSITVFPGSALEELELVDMARRAKASPLSEKLAILVRSDEARVWLPTGHLHPSEVSWLKSAIERAVVGPSQES